MDASSPPPLADILSTLPGALDKLEIDTQNMQFASHVPGSLSDKSLCRSAEGSPCTDSCTLLGLGVAVSRAPESHIGSTHDSQRLPQEVWDHVLDHLRDDRKTLVACSLTCRAWVPATRWNLWHTIQCPSSRKATSLLNALPNFPERAASTRNLSIYATAQLSLVLLFSSFVNLVTLTVTAYLGTYEEGGSEEPFRAMRLPHLTKLSLRDSIVPTTVMGHILSALPRLSTLRMDDTVLSGTRTQAWRSTEIVTRLVKVRLETLVLGGRSGWGEPNELLFSSPICQGLRTLVLRYLQPDGVDSNRMLAATLPLLRTAGPSLEVLTLMVTTRGAPEQIFNLLDFLLNTSLAALHIGFVAKIRVWADRLDFVLNRLRRSPAIYSLRRLDVYLLLHDCREPARGNYMQPKNNNLAETLSLILRQHWQLVVTFHARGSAYAAGYARRVLAEYIVQCKPGLGNSETRKRLRFVHDLAEDCPPWHREDWASVPDWDDVGISGSVVLLDAAISE